MTLGAASYLVVACGGAEEPAESGGQTAAEEASQPSGSEAPEPSGGESIAAESDVAPGEAVNFVGDSGEPAVLVHLEDGDFVAYSAVCTHQQCEVAYQDGSLACPCHGSMFDPANGAEVTAGPAPTPLEEIPVEVRDGEIFRA